MKHGCKHAPRGETFNISPHQKGFLVPSTLCALYRRRLSGLRAHDRRVRGTALPLPSPSITRHTEAEGAPSSPPRPFPSPISRTLLVRDLALDIVDSIAALNLERDGLAREGLDEDLHVLLCVVLLTGGCIASMIAGANERHSGVQHNLPFE